MRATDAGSRVCVEDIIANEALLEDAVDEFHQKDDKHVKALVEDYMCHDAYMMSVPHQLYITCCSGTVVMPRATLEPLVMVVDTDLSLQLATIHLLHDVLKCSGRNQDPHRICTNTSDRGLGHSSPHS